ncbi:tRNA pseudouridine synthase-like protein [Cucurbitaria berberidis CBS 394.84]|uniref:tRNA pseudouridine synthase 1 n=1 Tax=Cucurbitaria berberidis CBS 394.84 TaxID=1168544 RepID=A0A9P4GJI5_9PLEO|nr:tRNA pseudouridine synthase-like protein [Cucurbitaria berberidis CBS 394.84]KAF1847408.1 tRNA pseudouridine synthase-like protein [Cucurbitaria berberidis CBS 394.84]
MADNESSRRGDNDSPNHDRKRKWADRDRRNASRGGGRVQNGSRQSKKRNTGRTEHNSSQLDRRGRNETQQAKIKQQEEKGENERPALPAAFPPEEVEAEERRPKRKVAVMIGYSGTGYKGMQIDNKQKTIEGDLFNAFVAAGAISKANASDPKKSSLVRCARTDKGVHAAGNVVSLKLIIEEDDIVEKINSHLSEQIRVWGIQRTIGSFSCYQACDSRWYEYLIPTHSFLPPHPSSFIGKKLEEYAEKENDMQGYRNRQAEVANFWPDVEEKYIKPIFEALDDSIRPLVQEALYNVEAVDAPPGEDVLIEASIDDKSNKEAAEDEVKETIDTIKKNEPNLTLDTDGDGTRALPDGTVNQPALEEAIKTLKKAYLDAKKAYRISPERQARVQTALDNYLGTRKYHNYTVHKKFNDKSAQRYIKSFKVAPQPIIINDTEWLSLKVHGQSFMMHQIRKMVGMAALTVRCGTDPKIMEESFGNVVVRIPKAPGLGLLLERPVFDSYNEKQASQHGREKIDFNRFNKEIEEFKEREIYQRIFREEAQGNQFNTFFTHLDNYKDSQFLYLTSGGIGATKRARETKSTQQKFEEDSEDENASGGEG